MSAVNKIDEEQHTMGLAIQKSILSCADLDGSNAMCPGEQ